MLSSLVKRISVFILVLTTGTLSAQVPEQRLSFNRDIRPILSSNCFECHGNDDANRKADLRLDASSDWISAKKAGAIVIPGRPDESELFQRISADDPDVMMPPPDSHKELKPREIATLREWIRQGADWEGHWSFISPRKPSVPETANHTAAQVANPIDQFILQRLSSEKLSPNSSATKERLLRRVTLDLTGLPPSIKHIDAFLADDSPNAWEKVVDRLLASPHYGERMALMWMDAARYGDTSVFHADGPRDMWPWRDWVIAAYNKNMPFDQFTIEQLAGDLLPDATDSQQVATGFLRNNATTDEGGLIEEEYRVEYAVDRVKTTSMVWMGLSMECAQCHNHKYDPITQKEYYQFFAYFNQAADPGKQTRNGNQKPVVDIFDTEKLQQAKDLEPRIKTLEAKQQQRRENSQTEFAAWLKKSAADSKGKPALPGDMLAHFPLNEKKGRDVTEKVNPKHKGRLNGPVKWVAGKFGNAFQCVASNYINAGDVADFDQSDAFSYGAWIKPQGNAVGAIVARMDNDNAFRGYDLLCSGGHVEVHLVHSWPGNAIKVRTKNKLKKDAWQHVFATYDGSSTAKGVKIYFDGVEQPWDIQQNGLKNTIRTKVPLHIGRRNTDSGFKGLIDDVRVYKRSVSAAEVSALAGNDVIRPLLVKTNRSKDDLETLHQHFLTNVDKRYQSLTKQITAARNQITNFTKPIVNVMVMNDVKTMRPTYVLSRGNYDAPIKDQPVQPGVPSMLPPLPKTAPANRLGLAQWLVRKDHPLTARVAVNRYWSMLFGTGLVKTVEDFGAQGAWPTHPDLLDWLATDFMEHNWDVKRAIKQIVMSATYRQSTRSSDKHKEFDPENRLLARGPGFRLQGEFVRDNALAASGLLVDKIGGPGVKPYQPDGLWNEVSLNGNLRFKRDSGEKLFRRSMYTYWKRSAPAPAMTIFDAPTREKCIMTRSRTNTPLQALVTLNDEQFVEAARALAQRSIQEVNADIEKRIVYAYRLATGIRPSGDVVSVLKDAYNSELVVFRKHPERAAQLLATGESKRDETIDVSEHAALTIVTSIILNLDETLTRS